MKSKFLAVMLSLFVFSSITKADCQRCCDKLQGDCQANDSVFRIELKKQMFGRRLTAIEQEIASCVCCHDYNKKRMKIKKFADDATLWQISSTQINNEKATVLMQARDCCENIMMEFASISNKNCSSQSLPQTSSPTSLL